MIYKRLTEGIRSFLMTIGIIDEDEREGRLKLEAHKILPFNGSETDWPKWKSGTKVTLTATGYGKILTSEEYAKKHKGKNKIVYAQLSGALNDGTAQHLIEEYEENEDGYSAWQSLTD